MPKKHELEVFTIISKKNQCVIQNVLKGTNWIKQLSILELHKFVIEGEPANSGLENSS